MCSHLLLMHTVRGAYVRLSISILTRISLRCCAASLQRFSYNSIQRFWHGFRGPVRHGRDREWPCFWFSGAIRGKFTCNLFLLRTTSSSGFMFPRERCRSWNGAEMRRWADFSLFVIGIWFDTWKPNFLFTLESGYEIILRCANFCRLVLIHFHLPQLTSNYMWRWEDGKHLERTVGA